MVDAVRRVRSMERSCTNGRALRVYNIAVGLAAQATWEEWRKLDLHGALSGVDVGNLTRAGTEYHGLRPVLRLHGVPSICRNSHASSPERVLSADVQLHHRGARCTCEA